MGVGVRPTPSLTKFEIGCYFLVYLMFLCYGLINVYSIRNQILRIKRFDFAEGWTFFDRPRDNSNDELENFKTFLSKNYMWYVLHVTASELFRRFGRNSIPIGHTLIGVCFILFTYQIPTVFLIFLKLTSFYIVSRFHTKWLNWLIAAIWTGVINVIKNSTDIYETLGYHEYYELIIMLSWCILKCLSYNLSVFSHDTRRNNNQHSICNYLGYTLYFPTMIFGPFMIFDRYVNLINNEKNNMLPFRQRIFQFLRDIWWIGLWLMFMDFSLHYIYVHYMEQDINAVKLIQNSFGLYGFGYLMGQFFHLHYTVTYGLGIALAKMDQIDPPARPRCIGRIHFYSDMWKHFDQGLYEFLFKHIYASMCKKTSSSFQKTAAILATFGFVYIWHGYFLYILIWTVLNLVCLAMERTFKLFFNSRFYSDNIALKLSIKNQIRLFALLGTQIFIPSAISNFYFFAGEEIGNHFINSTYNSGIGHYVCLTMCCYCIFQCSEWINKLNSPS